MEQTKVHFHNLDILRLICAIAVAIGHSYEGYIGWLGVPPFLKEHPTFKSYLDVFISNFSMGVNMFFVISGFLITYLLLTEKERFGNINIGKFIIRRSLRIWPLYYAAIILGAGLVYIGHHTHPNYLANLFFWNNFNAIKTGEWQYPFAHFWSICVEEHFYIVWPIVVFLVPSKRLIWVILAGIGSAMAFRYFVPSIYPQQEMQMALYLHTISRADEILLGALLAYIHYHKPITMNVHIGWRVAVFTLFIGLLLFTKHADFWVWGVWSIVLKKYIYLGCIMFWMLNYLFNPNAWFNFSGKNVFHYLGKISFGIYIYHNMMIVEFINTYIRLFGTPSMTAYFFWYFLLLIIISILSFELYEKYFLKLKDKFALVKTQR